MSLRVARVAGNVALLAALGATGMPASATINSQCGGAVSANETCSLVLAGPDLSVLGSVSFGPITIEIRDPLGRTLLHCSSPRGYCNASTGHLPNLGQGATLPTGVPLTCNVFSSGTGTYICTSRTL